MNRLKIGRRRKQISLLTLVLTLLVLPAIMLFYNSSNAYAWSNSHFKKTDTPPPWPHDHEASRIGYLFGNDDGPLANPYREGNYGAHDWIADSALRLIALSGVTKYRNQIKWLLNYSYSDKYEGVPFKDLDKAGYDLVSQYQVNKWYAVKYYETADDQGSNGLGNYIYDHDSSSITEKGKAEFLKTRRYSNFLFGTMIPDFSIRPNFHKNDVMSERAGAIEDDWNMKGSVSHHVWFEYDGSTDKVLFVDSEGAALAAQAANHAVEFLTTKYGPPSTQVEGKYEIASVCLGGMTHFIADVSCPPHTLKHSKSDYGWETHAYWDKYVDMELNLRFTENNMYFPMGGPDWSEVEPLELTVFDTPVLEALVPMDAYAATQNMAYITFTAIDDDWMGDNAAPNMLNNDPFQLPAWIDPERYENRIRILLKWAVYFSACAILGVLKRVKDIENKDTTTGRIDLNPWPLSTARQSSMRDIDQIIEAYDKSVFANTPPISRENNPPMSGILFNFAMLAPFLAVMALPLVVVNWINKKDLMDDKLNPDLSTIPNQDIIVEN